jgi:cytidine deaminase
VDPTIELFDRAIKAAGASYSPYSNFRVGAALLCEDGSVVTGTNVENRSFGLTICAERSAVVSAVSQGKRTFAALAISCPDADYAVGPCGACRQVISEFVGADFPVYFAGKDGVFVKRSMGQLLPDDSLHELGGTPLNKIAPS